MRSQKARLPPPGAGIAQTRTFHAVRFSGIGKATAERLPASVLGKPKGEAQITELLKAYAIDAAGNLVPAADAVQLVAGTAGVFGVKKVKTKTGEDIPRFLVN